MNKKIKIGIIHSNNLFKYGLKILLGNERFITKSIDCIDNEEFDVLFLECTSQDECIKIIENTQKNSINTKIIVLTDVLDPDLIKTLLEFNINGILTQQISENFILQMFDFVNDNGFILSGDVYKVIKEANIAPITPQKISRAQFKTAHANLTQREYEVLKLVVDGKSNAQIAEILTISEHTAKAHVCNIIQKLVVDDRTQAAVKALREGIV